MPIDRKNPLACTFHSAIQSQYLANGDDWHCFSIFSIRFARHCRYMRLAAMLREDCSLIKTDASALWRFLITSSSLPYTRVVRDLWPSLAGPYFGTGSPSPAYPLRPPTPRDVALFPLSDRWQQQHNPPLVSLIAALGDLWHYRSHPWTDNLPPLGQNKSEIFPFSGERKRDVISVYTFFLWNRIFPLYYLAAGSLGYLSPLPLRFNRAKGAFCEIGR